LQERRDIGDAVARIALNLKGFIELHASAGGGAVQIEELLVGVEGFMFSIDPPGQRQGINRFAVDGQLAAIKVGLLLRSTNAGDPAA